MPASRIIRRLLVTVTPPRLRPHLVRFYRTTRFRLNTHLGRCPTVFFALHRLDPTYEDRLASPEKDIVIEGVPRVALTHTVHAFSLAQSRTVTIATHTHLPANVLRAVALGIPVLVVIREPAGAVHSTLLRNRDLTQSAVFERYLRFHRPLLPIAERIVFADFAQVTSDPGEVIDRLNRRFGTDFLRHVQGPAAEKRIAAELAERDRLLGLDALASFRPNSAKEQARDSIRIDRESRQFRDCDDVYRSLLARCND